MKPLHFPRSTRRRRFSSGAALTLLSTTALAVLGGCLTDGDVGRGTTDETNTARIVGPGGSSAPGAVVRVFAIGDSTRSPLVLDTTDQEGRYSLDGLPEGEYNLLATSRDSSLALYRDSVVLGPAAKRVDTLARPGSLSGRIELEPGDNPLTVTVQAVGTDLITNVDLSGQFSIAQIPRGDYTLRVVTTLREYTPTYARVRVFEDSALVLRDPIRLVYTGTEPRIFGPDGFPAAGAQVRISSVGATADDPARTILTDAKGRYSLQGLAHGRYALFASSEGLALFRDSILLAPGVVRVDTLRRAGSLQGRLEFEHGLDSGQASVELLGSGIRSIADSTGVFELDGVPGGRYTLRVATTSPDYAPMSASVAAIDDSSIDLGEAIRPPFVGVPPIQGMSLGYDTLSGLVRLHWRRNPAISRYRIIREPVGTEKALTWETGDTAWTDTVFHLGQAYRYSRLETSELTMLQGGRYKVCGKREDGSLGRCASVFVRPVTPYDKARRSGMRWTRIGSLEGSVSHGGANLRIAPAADGLWLFEQVRADYSTPPSPMRAWKSADGSVWTPVSDSLPVSALVPGYGPDVYASPQVWNDSLWGVRVSGDSLQLFASRDGSAWTEIPLPHTFRLRLEGEIQCKPTLLATPQGLEVFCIPVAFSPRVPPGARRNAAGEWEPGTEGLNRRADGGPMSSTSLTQASVASGSWILNLTNAMVDEVSWIERPSATPGTGRRMIPLRSRIWDFAELDGHLYMPGSYSAVTGAAGDAPWAPTLFTSTLEPDSPWWSIDLPSGCTHVLALTAWKGKLLLVSQDGGIWQGEPTAAP